jgi:hypothetical protein
MLYVKKWVSGDTAPTVTYPAGTTLTDTMSCQVGACSGAKLSEALTEIFDQLPSGFTLTDSSSNNTTGITYAASTSTTVVGPTGALPANAAPGSLALAYVAHETNITTGTIGVVTGGTDTLTWAEGGEGATTTVTPAAGTGSASEDEPAWAVDWAIVPSDASMAIGAKQAAATLSGDSNKPNASVSTAGKGWGVLFTLRAANNRATGLLVAA